MTIRSLTSPLHVQLTSHNLHVRSLNHHIPVCAHNKRQQSVSSVLTTFQMFCHCSSAVRREPSWDHRCEETPLLHPRITRGTENNPVMADWAQSSTASIFDRKIRRYKSVWSGFGGMTGGCVGTSSPVTMHPVCLSSNTFRDACLSWLESNGTLMWLWLPY